MRPYAHFLVAHIIHGMINVEKSLTFILAMSTIVSLDTRYLDPVDQKSNMFLRFTISFAVDILFVISELT